MGEDLEWRISRMCQDLVIYIGRYDTHCVCGQSACDGVVQCNDIVAQLMRES